MSLSKRKMFKTKPKFGPGDKVFAKVRGYRHWPARIEGLADVTPNKMKYNVYFYGTGETAVIKEENVFSFVENKARFGKRNKLKIFTNALLQIKAELRSEEVKLANELVEKHASKQTVAANVTDTSKTIAHKRSSTSAKPQKQQASSSSSTVVLIPPATNKPKGKAENIRKDPEAKKLLSSTPTNVTEADMMSIKVSPEGMSRSAPKRLADFEDNISEDVSKTIKLGKPKDDEKEDSMDDSEDCTFASVNESEKVNIPLKLNRPNFSNERSGEKMSDLQEIMNERKGMTSEEVKQFRELLNTESLLLGNFIDIKSALNLQEAHPDECIASLDKVNELKITPIMLKKNPVVMNTITLMRSYVGNIHEWNMTGKELEAFQERAGLIREKSDHIYNKFKSLFLNQEINDFKVFFNKELKGFQEKTCSMPLEQFYSIVQEPE